MYFVLLQNYGYLYRNDKVATMHFYNLVTTLAQPCIMKLWEGCDKAMLYEHCHKVATMHLVTTLYFETVERLLQGGGKAVTKALSQPCIMKLLQDCQLIIEFQNVYL